MRTILIAIVVTAMACLASKRFTFGSNDRIGPSSHGEVAGYGQQSQKEFSWKGSIAPGRAIEIKGVKGDIRAEASSDNEVEVSGIKRASRSDPDSVKIEVLKHEDGVTICAVYPSDDQSEPNNCQPGRAGRINAQKSDVVVNFTVRVPPGVRFAGSTVSGDVEAASLKSDVEAYSVNGSIRVSTSTHARGSTVNGSIKASLGDTTWEKTLGFETVNGSINIELQKGANTEVRAETFNGSVSTDFPLVVHKRSMTGTIGSGGRVLIIKSLNGSIQLRQLT